jgi:hypothetical protein
MNIKLELARANPNLAWLEPEFSWLGLAHFSSSYNFHGLAHCGSSQNFFSWAEPSQTVARLEPARAELYLQVYSEAFPDINPKY